MSAYFPSAIVPIVTIPVSVGLAQQRSDVSFRTLARATRLGAGGALLRLLDHAGSGDLECQPFALAGGGGHTMVRVSVP